jgi:hypothetical protein
MAAKSELVVRVGRAYQCAEHRDCVVLDKTTTNEEWYGLVKIRLDRFDLHRLIKLIDERVELSKDPGRQVLGPR